MKNKLDKKVYIIFLIAIIISISSSYVLAQTLVNSNDVYYEDNSGLAVNNVQAAIDGTCTKFSNELTNFLNKIYPVGSIYISTASTNPSSFLGGTWEAYGKGQTLVGIDSNQTEFNTVGKTGGTKSVSTTLKEANLPSHSHTINHTHTTSTATTTTMNLTAESAGSHQHKANISYTYGSGGQVSLVHSNNKTAVGEVTLAAGAHTHNVTGSVTIPALSTDSISTTTSGTTGSGTAFSTSTLQPYITVYMWHRTK